MTSIDPLDPREPNELLRLAANQQDNIPLPTQRVLAAAEYLGLPVMLRILPQSTATAEEAALACECEVDFIVKSLLFKGKTSKKPFLLLVSGIHKVNEKNLALQVGEVLEKAKLDTVQKLTGFEVGGVAPIGLANRIPVLMDEYITRFGRVWCAAGTPNTVFSVVPRLLARATSARVLKID